MNTLTKRIEVLEGDAMAMSPGVDQALRKMFGITGPVPPNWLTKVPTAKLLQGRGLLIKSGAQT